MAAKVLGGAPVPAFDRIAAKDGVLTIPWREYLQRLPPMLDRCAVRLAEKTLTTQGAAIAATDLAGSDMPEGLYRVSYYARVTRAATTSSSLTVTVAWTDGTVAMSQAGTAITGNAVTSYASVTLLLWLDANTAVNYSTAYASVGATSMQYKLCLTLERVNA